MVELKDFVSETLKQLIEGITMAQAFAKEQDASINPKELEIHSTSLHVIDPRGTPAEHSCPIPSLPVSRPTVLCCLVGIDRSLVPCQHRTATWTVATQSQGGRP